LSLTLSESSTTDNFSSYLLNRSIALIRDDFTNYQRSLASNTGQTNSFASDFICSLSRMYRKIEFVPNVHSKKCSTLWLTDFTKGEKKTVQYILIFHLRERITCKRREFRFNHNDL
jgi:hypothetical protein